MASPSPSPLAARLGEVEHFLDRILASGWRNAEGDRAGLGGLADELAELGLTEFGDRLRAIGQAADAAEALQRIAIATAACRMLQARLIAALPAPTALESLHAGKAIAPPRLLVVAPMNVAGQELWACTRLERGVAAELVLLEPPAPRPIDSTAASQLASRSGFLRQLIGGAPSSGAPTAPWLRAELHEDLLWRETLPLGDGTIDRRVATQGGALLFPEEKDDVAARARASLHRGGANDHDVVVRAGGALRLRVVERALSATYTWLDPTMQSAFERSIGDDGWAVAWVTPQSLTPLAIIRPGGLLRRAQLAPLVLGAASVPLGD